MSGEIVSVHVGQAGCQLGHAQWELFCLEHCVHSDGTLAFGSEPISRRVLFSDGANSNYCTPRAIFCDTEPIVIDEIRCGAYRSLFHSQNLISHKQSAAGNYAIGHNVIGPQLLPSVSERLRHLIESCDRLDGCMLFHSLGGGTGSGFTTLLIEHMTAHYGAKLHNLQLAIYPSPRLASGTVEPYNTVAALAAQFNCSGGFLVLDNESLYSIIRRHFGRAVQSSDFSLANRLASQVVSSITCSIRFGGDLSARLDEISTNLIPYPEQRFLIPSYAPIHAAGRRRTVEEAGARLVEQALTNENALAKVGLAGKPRQAACFLFRGSIAPAEANRLVQQCKARGSMQVQSWLLTGLKVGHCPLAPIAVPGSGIGASRQAVAVISNSPAIVRKFNNIGHKFDQLFQSGAYLHTFTANGLSEEQFATYRQALKTLETNYLKGVDNPSDYYSMGGCNLAGGVSDGLTRVQSDYQNWDHKMRFR